MARVVVDAEEVERRRNCGEVAVADQVGGEQWPEVGHHVLGVLAPEDRVEEPPVVQTVDPARQLGRGRGVVSRCHRVEVEGGADAGVRGGTPQGLDGQPVAEQQVMAGRDRRRMVAAAWSVDARAVAEEGRAPRLVEGDEVADPVTQQLADHLGELGQPAGGVASGPPARVLDVLRQVPVVEGHPGRDPGREQLVDQPVVERGAPWAERSPGLGEQPRPRDREPVGAQPEVAHQRDVVGVPVVVVARDVAVVAVADPARRGGEGVPDGRGPATLGDRSLHLVRRRGGAPDEVGRELLGVHHGIHQEVGQVDAAAAGLDGGHDLTPPSMMPPTIWRPKMMKTTRRGRTPRSVPAITSAWSV